LAKLWWFCQFAEKDVLYILDRDREVRRSMTQSKASDFGGKWQHVDIILVQYDNKLYCVKEKKGTLKGKTITLACDILPEWEASTEDSKPEEKSNIFQEAKMMRLSLIEQCGAECERCGYNNCSDGMDFYKDNGSRVKMIRFGKLRDYKEVMIDLEDCQLLCANCLYELPRNDSVTYFLDQMG